MLKWTKLLWTGLAACFLTLPVVNAGTDMGCLPPPPPPKDYLKKTVRVEIKGQLVQFRRQNDGSDPALCPIGHPLYPRLADQGRR